MAKLLGNFLILMLLLLPTTMMFAGQGRTSSFAMAEDAGNDPIEGEDDEATVETDEGAQTGDSGEEGEVLATEKEEEEDQPLKPSENADTFILFMNPDIPSGDNREIPAGKLVRVLVGFTNKGDKDFIVETMDGSFRYPQDFSFYVHNFTTVSYSQVVEPKKQATFEYGFTANEAFNARPFGLTINLNYKDSEGNYFQNAVYNETITVVEPDEGLDGETFFLYVFLAAVAVLLLVGAQQLLSTYGRKRLMPKHKPIVEMGTQKSDVDYDWLPKETLQEMNRSPRRSPKQSPRQRRSKRSSGSGEE
ncbi:translocon-associated protein subunit alpha-like [Haliotis asinina]|uniref:translocon-associated protein subunit alpha-like n=1 Tax=Haliotis asinina TaxID=109174 RepID=UPI00353211D1